MKKKKDLDLAPSRRERKTLGQYILLFFLVLYTLFCALPIVLVFVAQKQKLKALLKKLHQKLKKLLKMQKKLLKELSRALKISFIKKTNSL